MEDKPRPNMKMKDYINIFKGPTGLFVLLMIAYFNAWQNLSAWVYLGLHGSYGILWILKSHFFPDKNWERSISWPLGIGIWLALACYLASPWLLISRNVQLPGWYLAICSILFVLGIFFHLTSDMQKYTALRIKPNHLIQDGLFKRVRNPNYFGELLVYGSLAMLSFHWIPFIVLGLYIILYWVPNMIRKDRSLARYDGFEEYKQKSKLFIPFIV
jgi:protein-S-isoprenylcysteine O-methyltransferase Ste14